MAEDGPRPEETGAIEALREIAEAVTEVAERMFGVPDGTAARCPRS
jgi:hypothetical protein